MILIVLSHLLPSMLPGDFHSAMYSSSQVILTEKQVKEYEEKLRNLTPIKGFKIYLNELIHGNMGTSLSAKKPVTTLIADALPWTLLLGGLAQFFSILIGFITGVESGWFRGSGKEKRMTTGLVILESIPELVTGTILILLFAFTWGIFPPSGAETPYSYLKGISRFGDIIYHLILPLTALLLTLIPGNYLMMRNSMLLVMNEKYISTAISKNLTDRRIRYVHGARNALMPLVTRIGIRIAYMTTGLIVIETIFKYPGMGTLLSSSILMRDLPVTRGIILIASLLVVSINFFMEIVYRYIDPRLRNEA